MKIKQLYKLYFKCEIGDQKRTWAPHIICWRCTKGLHTWIKTGRGLPFAIPMIWREPRDHLTDCYFCAFSINGVHGKSIKRLPYPNIPSAIRPIPHSIELPVPVPPSTPSISSNRSPNSSSSNDSDISIYAPNDITCEPHLITNSELNDLVRDLKLTKIKVSCWRLGCKTGTY
jgi:hypothetical protein